MTLLGDFAMGDLQVECHRVPPRETSRCDSPKKEQSLSRDSSHWDNQSKFGWNRLDNLQNHLNIPTTLVYELKPNLVASDCICDCPRTLR